MDCRETGTRLVAFHDGELSEADRARVATHLEGCPACRALLAGLARADDAAGVPDPGAEYWDGFNARVSDRIGKGAARQDAGAPKVAVLRPKRGWARQQLRYLIPAVAAAALVVVVVRHAGIEQGTPAPPAATSPADRLSEAPPPLPGSPAARAATGKTTRRPPGDRVAGKPVEPAAPPAQPAGVKAMPDFPAADATRAESPPAAVPPTLTPPAEDGSRPAAAPAPSGHLRAEGRFAVFAMDERGLPAEAKRKETAPPRRRMGGGPGAESTLEPRVSSEQAAAGGAASSAVRSAAKAESSPDAGYGKARIASPCDLVRKLAGQERLEEAEAAQRDCLKRDRDAATQEEGLVFLAELLDRQARFAEADAIIMEVQRRFPRSLPLDRYLRQRPQVRQLPSLPGR